MIEMKQALTVEVRNGKWKEFNKHAVLVSEGIYVNNEKHGVWREYYDHTGTLMIEETYVNGIPHGPYTCFHPNGRVWSQGNFDNGLREGYFRVYDDQGKNIRNMLFIRNNKVENQEQIENWNETKAKQGT
jgi:antitoxin component YwqK of YwqJK toxin-antitoxin module